MTILQFWALLSGVLAVYSFILTIILRKNAAESKISALKKELTNEQIKADVHALSADELEFQLASRVKDTVEKP